MLQGETVSLKAGKNKIAYQMEAGDAGNVELDFVAVRKIK
jgi:hypothetical protein